MENAPRDLYYRSLDYFDDVFKHNVFHCVDLLNPSERSRIMYNVPRRYGGLGLNGVPSKQDIATGSYCKEFGYQPPNFKRWLFHNKALKQVRQCIDPMPGDSDSNLGMLYWWAMSHHRHAICDTRWDDLSDPCPAMHQYNKRVVYLNWLRGLRKCGVKRAARYSIEQLRNQCYQESYSIKFLGGYVV
jgi:hypothetical protein